MSTSRLTLTNITPHMSTVVCTTGKSRNEMPSKSNRPTPGQANTDSTTNATLTINTRLMPARVRTGMTAFLKACFAITKRSESPLMRASLMYSLPKTSSMADRARRMWAAVNTHPRENAGMTRCFQLPEPELGSQLRYTDRVRMRSSPTQKMGKDNPRMAKIFPKLSNHVLTRTAEKMPTGMPMTNEIVMATEASKMEAGRRWM